MKNTTLVIFFTFFLYGCINYQKGKRLVPQDFLDCYQKWELDDLNNDIEVKSIYFEPQFYIIGHVALIF